MPQYKEETVNKKKIKKPSLYKVILHNDDYTTMEFVVAILERIFHKSRLEAEKLMMEVHIKGQAVCGIYTYEIAVTKVEEVKYLAHQNSFPLLATVEVDE